MKKLLSVFLALLLAFVFPISTYAINDASGKEITPSTLPSNVEIIDVNTLTPREVNIDDVIAVPYVEIPVTNAEGSTLSAQSAAASRAANIRLEFTGCGSNDTYSCMEEYLLHSSGSLTVYVDLAVWAPESFPLEIGFLGLDSGLAYTSRVTGGLVDGRYFTFNNLPSGRYWMIVENKGSADITTGYLLYTVY